MRIARGWARPKSKASSSVSVYGATRTRPRSSWVCFPSQYAATESMWPKQNLCRLAWPHKSCCIHNHMPSCRRASRSVQSFAIKRYMGSPQIEILTAQSIHNYCICVYMSDDEVVRPVSNSYLPILPEAKYRTSLKNQLISIPRAFRG